MYNMFEDPPRLRPTSHCWRSCCSITSLRRICPSRTMSGTRCTWMAHIQSHVNFRSERSSRHEARPHALDLAVAWSTPAEDRRQVVTSRACETGSGSKGELSGMGAEAYVCVCRYKYLTGPDAGQGLLPSPAPPRMCPCTGSPMVVLLSAHIADTRCRLRSLTRKVKGRPNHPASCIFVPGCNPQQAQCNTTSRWKPV